MNGCCIYNSINKHICFAYRKPTVLHVLACGVCFLLSLEEGTKGISLCHIVTSLSDPWASLMQPIAPPKYWSAHMAVSSSVSDTVGMC